MRRKITELFSSVADAHLWLHFECITKSTDSNWTHLIIEISIIAPFWRKPDKPAVRLNQTPASKASKSLPSPSFTFCSLSWLFSRSSLSAGFKIWKTHRGVIEGRRLDKSRRGFSSSSSSSGYQSIQSRCIIQFIFPLLRMSLKTFASRHAVIRDSIKGASWQMDLQELNCLINEQHFQDGCHLEAFFSSATRWQPQVIRLCKAKSHDSSFREVVQRKTTVSLQL